MASAIGYWKKKRQEDKIKIGVRGEREREEKETEGKIHQLMFSALDLKIN